MYRQPYVCLHIITSLYPFSHTSSSSPFNPWPGSKYECSSREQILRFSSILHSEGLRAPVRWPRNIISSTLLSFFSNHICLEGGRDILAACGQLRTESMREKKEAGDWINQSCCIYFWRGEGKMTWCVHALCWHHGGQESTFLKELSLKRQRLIV